ncbi:Exodeoxyribonuclease 7 small subunit [Sphingomonas sp. RIT328]|nr:Exodeoxyribonuclease 7 small subunit [Sphingomonas sp. RIT328]
MDRAGALSGRRALAPASALPHSDTMDNPIESLTFEDALKELERIVGRLESGEATLDESIQLYERGDRLRQRCAERLDAAQARIEAIRLDAEGKPTQTRPFAAA